MLEVLQQGSSSAKFACVTSLTGTKLAKAVTSEERFVLESAALPARSIKAHADLIREGQATDQLYIVTKGRAFRYKTTPEGSRQAVAILVPGDIANLDTLAFDQPGYGVRFLSEGKVVPIPRERVFELISEYDGIGKALTRLALIENAILSKWKSSVAKAESNLFPVESWVGCCIFFPLIHLSCSSATCLLPVAVKPIDAEYQGCEPLWRSVWYRTKCGTCRCRFAGNGNTENATRH